MPETKALKTGRVLLSARDKPGIHEAITSVIRKAECTVMDSVGKSIDGYYLLRTEFSATDGRNTSLGQIREQFELALKALDLGDPGLKVVNAERRKKTMILVSEATYCMEEVLSHWKQGDLNIDIACVITNNERTRRRAAEAYPELDVIFKDAGDRRRDKERFESKKLAAESSIYATSQKRGVDFYTLAKWHRILMKEGPLLNPNLNNSPILSVHPSLLPSFIGGKAVLDAYRAGVKVSGATAHLVTPEDQGIDTGPKIAQITREVGNLSLPDFEKAVQFAEREALYKSVKMVSEDRFLIYRDPESGTRKTFIF
ncbi:MAG: hypothetical protein KGH94_02090 [Candidatus Micrarchaeota archaeon]|nr:hypothetical protein [Candidatus Micrarchaeota archaeon]